MKRSIVLELQMYLTKSREIGRLTGFGTLNNNNSRLLFLVFLPSLFNGWNLIGD